MRFDEQCGIYIYSGKAPCQELSVAYQCKMQHLFLANIAGNHSHERQLRRRSRVRKARQSQIYSAYQRKPWRCS